MPHELRWTVAAISDLREIYEFVGRDSISAADRLVTKLSARPEQLIGQPQSGRVIPEIGDERIREVIEGSYRIVYKIESDMVAILRVSHHARRLKI